MWEDPAAYLAARFATLYSGAPGATADDVDAACTERGVEVWECDRLTAWGYALPDAILIQPTAGAHVRAHELYHCWHRENLALGISYPPPDWLDTDQEQAAEKFARAVCGDPSEELARELGWTF